MSTLTSAQSLTSADLKDNLHDIQDNVVAPILMRYGRHIFLKFNDGAKARAWLGNMFKRVNARGEEHGTRFTVNIGFTYEGLKALGPLSEVAGQLSRGVPDRHAGPCPCRRRCRAARAGTLGGRPRAVPTFTRWRGSEPTPTKAAKRRRGSFAPKWRRPAASRSASFRIRWRWRMRTGSGPRASISVLLIRSRSRQSRALTRLHILAMACCSRMARGVR